MTALSDSDIAALRSTTPGCQKVIHFNHAGSSLMPQQVIDAVVAHTVREGEIGGYEAEDEAIDRINAVDRECDPRLGHGLLCDRFQGG
jgi:selenocysteine lyase/cysteine desulfurase